ncbi:MAG: hypothetical protein R6V58_13920, partial [Planctomycetota bacterium]
MPDTEATPLVVRNNDDEIAGGHVADFYDHLLDKGDTEKHARSRRNQVARLLKLAKAKRVSHIVPSRIQAGIRQLRDDGRSLQTCNHYLRSAKQFSRWLWRDGRAAEHTLA